MIDTMWAGACFWSRSRWRFLARAPSCDVLQQNQSGAVRFFENLEKTSFPLHGQVGDENNGHGVMACVLPGMVCQFAVHGLCCTGKFKEKVCWCWSGLFHTNVGISMGSASPTKLSKEISKKHGKAMIFPKQKMVVASNRQKSMHCRQIFRNYILIAKQNWHDSVIHHVTN